MALNKIFFNYKFHISKNYSSIANNIIFYFPLYEIKKKTILLINIKYILLKYIVLNKVNSNIYY